MTIEEILVDLKEFSEEGHTEFGYEMPLSEVREVIKALESQRRSPQERIDRALVAIMVAQAKGWALDAEVLRRTLEGDL